MRYFSRISRIHSRNPTQRMTALLTAVAVHHSVESYSRQIGYMKERNENEMHSLVVVFFSSLYLSFVSFIVFLSFPRLENFETNVNKYIKECSFLWSSQISMYVFFQNEFMYYISMWSHKYSSPKENERLLSDEMMNFMSEIQRKIWKSLQFHSVVMEMHLREQ